jgi:hypothetical protein
MGSVFAALLFTEFILAYGDARIFGTIRAYSDNHGVEFGLSIRPGTIPIISTVNMSLELASVAIVVVSLTLKGSRLLSVPPFSFLFVVHCLHPFV